MEGMRLQKYLASAGVASRRKSEELIGQGRISVDGIPVTEMGFRVMPGSTVLMDGKPVSIEHEKVYIMLNKPAGYVTTSRDQYSRPSVLDLVSVAGKRIYPVGRLDLDTSGLLLLTNDGDFAYRLTHPRHEIEKTYRATIIGTPSEKEMESFRKGLDLGDFTTSEASVSIVESSGGKSTVVITIREGKNRQVRRMCQAIGHPVIRLARISIGGLALGGLPSGKWRHLTSDELELFV